ncbi:MULTISPECIES: S-layer homology domain-containing protein [unclassified Leptolyngbya]|uniref:S-layer homology domain-containing protein n=1 Tax=unclassified Leptolyngbya TaxID=2650499 RepID=UPI003D31F3B4
MVESDVDSSIVKSLQKFSATVGLAMLCVLPLSSCANSPLAGSLRDSLAADPRLTGSPSPQSSPQQTAQLPPSFPTEVPRYPNASLIEARSTGNTPIEQSTDLFTRWSTSDDRDRIFNFYRDELQKNGWTLSEQNAEQGRLIASRQGLRVGIGVAAAQSGANFSIETQAEQQAAQPGTPSPSPTASPAPDSSSVAFSDVEKAPQELRSYINDLAQLGVLTSQTKSGNTALFEPNKTITRRVYARWLVEANNRIYRDRPARQIRLAVETGQSAFRDVPAKDADFAVIQGLAEAGLIPSPLSGNNSANLFRPDAPLTREDLILWKIPVDTRQVLPNATIESVKQTWGFQDANRIDPTALRAVYADFQNGDQANIRRAFGYTTIFQPKRSVTRAEAAAVLWYFGFQGDGISAQQALKGETKPQ